MIDILEIPVLSEREKLTHQLFEGIESDFDRKYRGFRHLECTLNDDETFSVYFYILDHFIGQEAYVLWDRMIPKSPFCWFVYDNEQPEFSEMYNAYINRFRTPLLLVSPESGSIPEGPPGNEAENPFSNHVNIQYDPENEAYLRYLISQSIEKVL
ncbi:MAG: hypothetical protein GF313_14885 [Caldithrix sp.]|nr:hypothetical protein [Caldithrix sp.]